MIVARATVAALVVLAATSAWAQPNAAAQDMAAAVADGPSLTLQAAVDAAVRGHPSLRGAQTRVLQAGAGIDAAQANYWPSVGVGISSQASDDTISGYDSHYVHRAELTASQLLYDFGRTASEVEQAEAQQDVTKTGVRQAYADVVRNTANAWLAVRQNRALFGVARDRLDAVKTLAKLAKRREVLGAGTQSDTAQARARVDSAQAQLLTARARVRRWRSELMHWVGGAVPPTAAGPLPSALPTVCKTMGGDNVVHDAAALRTARARVDVARAAEQVATTRMRPSLSLNASLSHGLGGDSARYGDDGFDTAVTLDLSMPLFQGGRLRSNQQAAVYGVQAAQATLQQTRLAANRNLHNAVVAWQRYRGLQGIQAQRIEAMRLTRELYRQQYLELGTRSLLDLLNAEQEYYGALADRINSHYQLYSLGLTCLYFTGGLHGRFTANADADAPADLRMAPAGDLDVAYDLPDLP